MKSEQEVQKIFIAVKVAGHKTLSEGLDKVINKRAITEKHELQQMASKLHVDAAVSTVLKIILSDDPLDEKQLNRILDVLNLKP